jgi:hypothetical protein
MLIQEQETLGIVPVFCKDAPEVPESQPNVLPLVRRG